MTTTSPSEPTLQLVWRQGTEIRSRTYRTSEPGWRDAFAYLAANPASHVRLLYNRP